MHTEAKGSVQTENTIESVWELCRQRMWKEAYRILGSRQDSEDAVMDAVERMIRNLHKIRFLSEDDLLALSVIYVRHTAIDIYNRNKSAPVAMEVLPEETSTDGPEERVMLSALEKQILALLAEMPAAMRDVLNLHMHFGFSIREIADALELSGTTVRVRLSRGRKWLREKLSEKGVDLYG